MEKLIAITTGEPAGIGPDIALEIVLAYPDIPLVLLGDHNLLQQRAAQLNLKVSFAKAFESHKPNHVALLHIPLALPAEAKKLNAENAQYVLKMLDAALLGCLQKRFSAVVTGPIHKGILSQPNCPFYGHTEYFAKALNVFSPVMMFVTDVFKVALVTRHIALRDVPVTITSSLLEKTIRILQEGLIQQFHCSSPHILVSGLNPHAGEGGLLGDEEKGVIKPVIQKLQKEGFSLEGPLPADTIFAYATKVLPDAILMMYHDQGLTALKALSFMQGVNFTLGLPIMRASVDHGIALELAGTGLAESTSLAKAVTLVHQLIKDPPRMPDNA